MASVDITTRSKHDWDVSGPCTFGFDTAECCKRCHDWDPGHEAEAHTLTPASIAKYLSIWKNLFR